MSTSPIYAQKVRFVQLTDVHSSPERLDNLKGFVKDINLRNDIDFVVFTGDNIDKARLTNLKAFLKVIKDIKIPVYVTMGNHDVYKQELSKEVYMKTVKKYLGRYHSDKGNYVFKKHGYIFVVMDGVKEVIPGPGGYYKQEELDWLDDVLTKNADNKVIILQHFPLLDYRVKEHMTYKRDNYLNLLKKHNNVLAIISGHYHQNREVYNDEKVYNIVSTPFFMNSTYKIIEVENDFIYTYLISND